MAKEVTPEQIQMLDEMVARAQKAADIIATYDRPVWTVCARLLLPRSWT